MNEEALADWGMSRKNKQTNKQVTTIIIDAMQIVDFNAENRYELYEN